MSEKLTLREKLNFDKNVTFGIEIEFSKAVLKCTRNNIYILDRDGVISSARIGSEDDIKEYGHWYVKRDYTVTEMRTSYDMGGEVVSPILTDCEKTYMDIECVCKTLKELHARNSGTSAAHIHIGSSILRNNPKYLSNFLKLWIAYEDVIYKFGYNGGTPRSSICAYATPMYKIYNSNRYEIENTKDFISLINLPFFRRICGINLTNCKDYMNGVTKTKNTIEIRTPNGTLNPITWQNNINFFVKLMSYATREDFDDELVTFNLTHNQYDSFVHSACKAYGIPNMAKATELAELIFKDDIDKKYFYKQYQKK